MSRSGKGGENKTLNSGDNGGFFPSATVAHSVVAVETGSEFEFD